MKKPFLFISALAATFLATAAPHTIQNTFSMTLVEIPAGTFQMGSTATNADVREKTAHQETIAKPFFLGQYEITQGDWQKIMGENPYDRDRSNPYYGLPGMAARITKPNHPATVSWNDAQEFIAALNRQDSQYHYRLPQKPNGNTPPVPEQPAAISLVIAKKIWTNMPGMAKTLPMAALIRSEQNRLTLGACTISTAMPGSG